VTRISSGRHRLAAALLLGSLLAFVGALVLPFLHARFQMEFPGWVPDILGLHDRLRGWLISKAGLPEGDRYLLEMIQSMFGSGEWLVGTLVGAFSVVFPAVKIALCSLLLRAASPSNEAGRERLTRALHILGPWSMADVFVVAVMVTVYKSDALQFQLSAGPGLVCYALSAGLSYLALTILQRPWKGPS